MAAQALHHASCCTVLSFLVADLERHKLVFMDAFLPCSGWVGLLDRSTCKQAPVCLDCTTSAWTAHSCLAFGQKNGRSACKLHRLTKRLRLVKVAVRVIWLAAASLVFRIAALACTNLELHSAETALCQWPHVRFKFLRESQELQHNLAGDCMYRSQNGDLCTI